METNYSDISQNHDVEFHNLSENVNPTDESDFSADTTWVYNNELKKIVSLPRPKILSFPTYYTPGTYKYGAAAYVPSYQDSVVLSSLDKYKMFHTGSVLADEHAINMRKIFSQPDK